MNPREGENVCLFTGRHLGFDAEFADKLPKSMTASMPNGGVVKSSNQHKQRVTQLRTGKFGVDWMMKEASAVVYKILFDSDKRKKIDDMKVEKLRSDGTTRVVQYYRKQIRNGFRPNIHEADAIFNDSMNRQRRVLPIAADGDKVQYYANVITDLWSKLSNKNNHNGAGSTTTRFFHQISLGVLYVMKKGITAKIGVHTTKILPRDEFLRMHLPPQDDLHLYGYKISDVTKGMKCINAKVRGWKQHPNFLEFIKPNVYTSIDDPRTSISTGNHVVAHTPNPGPKENYRAGSTGSSLVNHNYGRPGGGWQKQKRRTIEITNLGDTERRYSAPFKYRKRYR
jgi:hypothetical protein